MTVRYDITGTRFTESEAIIMELKPGEPGWLVREPENPHDPLAVAVYVRGRRVGYVPRYQNRVLAEHIDEKGSPATAPGMPTARAVQCRYAPDPKTGKPAIEV